ncbi:MAG: thioredoxin domain-containing protein [Stenomitos rutilans HA7619-LM2]|nr:thioredoxin domain-containing protein [Stenomitos rutilans HA7619-LM2]
MRYVSPRRWFGWLAGLLVLCFTLFGCSIPTKADSQVSPQLKEQVLQIIRDNPEAILDSVQAYQRKQQAAQQQAQQAFLQQTKTNPKALIGTSPTTGAKAGKVLLVEFSDFQCPYCSKAHAILQPFIAKHRDVVTLVYKHFPLTNIHAEAMPAAKAAWAAGQQGQFWAFHDALFTHQEQLGEPFYQETAKALKLDLTRFDRDRANAEAAIQQDVELGKKLGLAGTPFFVMNGEAFSGVSSVEELEQTLAQVSK